ncbi:MAG: GIY-YIG nuclease family protein [Gammaproteobacteria bacterium]|nr:MAG: GIY-YIG nuclease family protein [Gammaproteobacteria bacterium]
MSEKSYYVYLLTTWNNKVLYIGVTNNLRRRLYEHRNKQIDGFTKKYNVHKLVYFEETNNIRVAIEREKQIKGWLRVKKNQLVESLNPEWRDLSQELFGVAYI